MHPVQSRTSVRFGARARVLDGTLRHRNDEHVPGAPRNLPVFARSHRFLE